MAYMQQSLVRRASSGPGKRSSPAKSAAAAAAAKGKAKPLPFKSAAPVSRPEPTTQSEPKTAETESASTPANHAKDNSSSRPPPPPRKFSVAELVRTRWIALFGAGAAALCLGSFTASFVWLNVSQPAPAYCTGHEPAVPTGRPGVQSPLEFDLHLDKSEHRYGITKLRRRLGAEARGHVLEVAVGTGRNLEFYDWGALTAGLVSRGERSRDLLEKSGWGRSKIADVREVDSFTGVDISGDMLDVGLQRLRTVVPRGPEILPVKKPSFAALARPSDTDEGRPCLALLDGKFRLFQGDAQDALTPSSLSPDGRYDTVVQTFGLCSVRDPARLLGNMAAVVRPDTGRILLLEHGRSWWDLVNGLLDRSARGHFERFGCWWNRDIEAIVEDAQRKTPGLEVVEVQRPGWFKFGTHFWIELRVREDGGVKDLKREIAPAKPAEVEGSWSKWWDVGSSILTPKPK